MLATRILQKEGTFFFISYKAQDLLGRVRFTSRFYFEGERIEAEAPGDDDVARFIGSVEKSEKSFQRVLNKRKVKAIFNFYETAVTQPVIPGTILLFTEEQLRFEAGFSAPEAMGPQWHRVQDLLIREIGAPTEPWQQDVARIFRGDCQSAGENDTCE